MTAGRPRLHNEETSRIHIEKSTRQALLRLPGLTDDRKIRQLLKEKGDLLDDLSWAKEAAASQEERYNELNDRINFRRNNPQFGFPYGPWVQNKHVSMGASFCMVSYGKDHDLKIPLFNFKCACDSCKKEPYYSPEDLALKCSLQTGKLTCKTCGAVATESVYTQTSLFGHYCNEHIDEGQKAALA
jgi:hypothetical protein